MTEMHLLNILDDLKDNEFERFKCYLKYEKVGDIEPFKESKLSEAERQDVVDLMVQNYTFPGAVRVFKSILKRISRNDLVGKLPNISSGAEDKNSSTCVWERQVSSGQRSTLILRSNQRLMDIRTSFIDGISGPVLKSLLDKLFGKKVITDPERESADEMQNKSDKARFVIDTVRKKGEAASSEMIKFLCEVDPFLCKHLGLM